MAAASGVRALPWKRIIAFAQVVLTRLGDDIPPRERKRLAALVRRSKGDPRRLTADERREILRIIRMVDAARLSRELAALGATTRLLKR